MFSALPILIALLLDSVADARVSFVYDDKPAKFPMTMPAMQELIEKRKIGTIDQLLPLLPAKLRSNVSLMRKTRNTVQFASPEFPRILLYTPDARFLMAMSGDPNQPGYDRVEMQQFVGPDQNGRFKYIFGEIIQNGNGLHFNPQPSSCVSCHHSWPIWDPYSNWPEAFGMTHQSQWPTKPGMMVGGLRGIEAELKREQEQFAHFLQTEALRGRYGLLTGLRDRTLEDLHTINSNLSNGLTYRKSDWLVAEVLGTPGAADFRDALIFLSLRLASFLQHMPGQESLEARTAELKDQERAAYRIMEGSALRLGKRMNGTQETAADLLRGSANKVVEAAALKYVLAKMGRTDLLKELSFDIEYRGEVYRGSGSSLLLEFGTRYLGALYQSDSKGTEDFLLAHEIGRSETVVNARRQGYFPQSLEDSLGRTAGKPELGQCTQALRRQK